MRRLIPVAILAAAALAALFAPRGESARAEDVLSAILADAVTAGGEMRGDICWLEDFGLGIRLPAAPPATSAPRLLAGRAANARANLPGAWLYRADAAGQAALREALLAKGARAEGAAVLKFTPRNAAEVSGQSAFFDLGNGTAALLTTFAHAGGEFALMLQPAGRNTLEILREDLLSGMILLPAGATGAFPLLMEGRYACALPGWSRAGERLFRPANSHSLGLRFFSIGGGEFTDLAALQLAIEERLQNAGFRRSDGQRDRIAGADAFLGEYFGGSEGFVQRIWFASLEGGYLVALMQGPEAARTELADAARAMAKTITRVDLAMPLPGGGADFAQARAMRALAWQEGRAVRWGALFDNAGGGPALWRQPGVAWSARLLRDGREVAVQAGSADSSRELNPLAVNLSLELPDGVVGPVDVVLRVGGQGASTRITVR